MAGFDFRALAARARADSPDAALFDAIEADRTHGKRRDLACKGQRRAVQAELRDRFLHELVETRGRIETTRPATLEGLLAKLRHVAARTKGARLHAEAHAALCDAIAWLEPPKPKGARAAGRKRSAGHAGVAS